MRTGHRRGRARPRGSAVGVRTANPPGGDRRYVAPGSAGGVAVIGPRGARAGAQPPPDDVARHGRGGRRPRPVVGHRLQPRLHAGGADRNYSVEMFDGVAEQSVRVGVTAMLVLPPNSRVTANADVALELLDADTDT